MSSGLAWRGFFHQACVTRTSRQGAVPPLCDRVHVTRPCIQDTAEIRLDEERCIVTEIAVKSNFSLHQSFEEIEAVTVALQCPHLPCRSVLPSELFS